MASSNARTRPSSKEREWRREAEVVIIVKSRSSQTQQSSLPVHPPPPPKELKVCKVPVKRKQVCDLKDFSY